MTLPFDSGSSHSPVTAARELGVWHRSAIAMRLVAAAMLVMCCTACIGFVSQGSDLAIRYPSHIIDQAILLESTFSETSVSASVKKRFETLYFGSRTAQGLQDFFAMLRDRCEVKERIICVHKYHYALYAYGFVLWLPVSKSEVVVEDYVVSVTFPKEGDDVIPAMTVETQKTTVKDEFR